MALVAIHLLALPHPATTATSTPSPLFIIQHCALALTLGAVLATLVGAVEGSPNSLKPSPFSAFSHTWRESAGTVALVASIVCIVLEVYLYVCMWEQAHVCVVVGIVGMLALGIPWVDRERLRELRRCATS
ncbi:hypothetical protein BV25DRAFT_1820985 [Artomyces pyxidatus]|uniref:Uncharacterized protein n=1 Tax=Artomyces pyxidatus TaxID=48021 RepID=A0ACB8TC17_9AGAM|nr:hypothetical protein BV25DRAFT_1820985 [Artomyces pyxidatus]